MLSIVTDPKHLLSLTLHVGDSMTEADLRRLLGTIDEFGAALERDRSALATMVVIVDTENGPNAAQRKRIGEAAKRITRGYQVLVTHSAVVRAIMTAIRWFSPATPDHKQESFATFPPARDWLVARTGHPAALFDELHAKVRAEVQAQGPKVA